MSLLARLLDPSEPLVAHVSEVQDEAYHAALASERTRILRRRLLGYCGFAAVFLALSFFYNLATLIFRWDSTAAARAGTRVDLISDFVLIAIFGAAAVLIRTQKPDHEGLVAILRRLWALAGGVVVLTQPLAGYLNLGPDNPAIPPDEMTLRIGLFALGSVFLLHFVGSLIIPLTWREALTPVVLLWVTFSIVAAVLYPGHWALRALLILLFPAVGAPGVLWSWRSYTLLGERFHTRVLGERYGELKSELQYARRIHEALFPAEITRGRVAVRYWYEPMREIGGDFLYIHPLVDPAGLRAHPDGPTTVVLIDVSGHGVPAALAVNRLHGEIQRFLAEFPLAAPGELIRDLNSYTIAALSGQGMFATAIAIQVDPAAGKLRWASAGHPPAAVRPAGGGMDYLDSTCTMLGVLEPELFEAEQREAPVAPGDRIILFTDGAMDVRDESGAQLGLDELRRSLLPVRSASDDPLEGARRRIIHHRGRAPLADDCLVVQVTVRAPQTAPAPDPSA